MNTELKNKLYGTDIDKEISLFEYGLLIAPYTQDGKQDEYFAVYRVDNGQFDTGFITESQLNDIINGKEWASEADIQTFLSFIGSSREEWLQLNMVHKLSDCLSHWGYLEIMGGCYNSIDTEKAKELYL